MVTKTAKPPKVTAALLQEYMDCIAKKAEFDAAAKPFNDKAKELAIQITEGLEAAEVTTLKRGAYRATLVSKPGLVSWKNECVKRLAAGELEQIQEALPNRICLDVQPA